MLNVAQNPLRRNRPGPSAWLGELEAWLVRVTDTVLRWQELSAQRQALLQLDDHLLADIGISRADALREAQRSIWDDPLQATAPRVATPQPRVCCQP